MAAMATGKIDATVQSYPEIFRARKLGMNILEEVGASQKDYRGFLDMSLVDEIEQEGFIQKLYAR